MRKQILFIEADRELREVFTGYTAEPEIREAFADYAADVSLFPMYATLDEVRQLWIGFSAGYRRAKLHQVLA